MNIKQRIGVNVRNTRLLKNISQQTLAEKAEVSLVTIARLERGKYNISICHLYSIMKALDQEGLIDAIFPHGLKLKTRVKWARKN